MGRSAECDDSSRQWFPLIPLGRSPACYPHVSAMHGLDTLNHVYFAWGLSLLFLACDVAAGRESISGPAAKVMLACFAYVFALGPFGHFAGQWKACALMVLLWVA